jgi:hypothetical protein
MEGKGRAQYSVDGGATFRWYTGPVNLSVGTDLMVKAVPDRGFVFDRWETPEEKRESQISFTNVRASLHLDLYFASDNTGLFDDPLIWWIIALLFLATLLFLIFLYRRRYGLILTVRVEGEAVQGVAITFKVEKDGETRNGTETTNSKGKCRIVAKKDSIVTIIMAAKNEKVATNLPVIVLMEKRRVYSDIVIE